MYFLEIFLYKIDEAKSHLAKRYHDIGEKMFESTQEEEEEEYVVDEN